MALDQSSEYIFVKDTIEHEINNSLSAGRQAYNFSVDEIMEEFLGSLYGWGNFDTIVLITLYIPTFFIALCGNILVIITVTGKKALRQVRNYYLVNLALADLTITLFSMPTSVGAIVHRLWIYGHFLCKVTTFLQGMAVAASIFTLVAVSIDRFISVQFPTSKRRVKKSSEAVVMIIIIWVVAASIMIPLLLVRQVDEIPLPHFNSLGFCVEKWISHDYRLAFGVLSLLVVFIIPATILAICYARIGETLYSTNFERVNSNSSVQTVTSRKRAARSLVILVLLFLIFWLPYNITSLTLDISGKISHVGVLRYTLWLGHAHSAVNPVMYWCLNKRLREGISSLRLICCKSSTEERKPTPLPIRQAKMRVVRKVPNVIVITTRRNPRYQL